MSFLRFRSAMLAACAVIAVPAMHCQQFSAAARPTVRVAGRVDNAVRTTLSGSVPGLLKNAQIGARLSSTERLQHVELLLSSSPEQEAALGDLMAEQQDKGSPNYHKWLTPSEFGAHFGVSDADLAKVSNWLQGQGLTIDSVSSNRRVMTFSGSVGQVESAFQTEMRSVTVNGAPHRSNVTAISIPTALAPVVVGIPRLNDVAPAHAPGHVSQVQLDGADTRGTATPLLANPQYGVATGTHYVTPGDTAVIYNTTPLTSAGINGTGQTITIIGRTNIDIADVQKFRSMFGLPKNDPTVLYVDQDPGLNSDDTEAYLDVEWAGALAPYAKINFVISSPNYFGGDIDDAALYAVENNLGDIISLSYGGCEFGNGAQYTAYWNSLWEEAAAQGQTALVSSGDSGAAGCTNSGNSYASQSSNGTVYSVNSLGSSAFNIAVGGSMFVDWNQSQYWNGTGGTTIPFSNAKSYIPETPLNQSALAPNYLNSASSAYVTGSGVFAGGGGISVFTSRPAWQTGSGIPTATDTINIYSPSNSTSGIATGYTSNGTHRLVPDLVNIGANGHDGTLFCASSLCSTTSTNGLGNAGIVGGTSVATPVQAGIQALVNQQNGGRLGNVLPNYYRLAALDYAQRNNTSNCEAVLGTSTSSVPVPPASNCNFHDVVSGSNTVPAASSGTTGIGFLAGIGFDEASGLGSTNAANVALNYASVNLASASVAFTLTPTTGVTHGGSQSLSVTVTANANAAVPTGDVSLIAETSTPNGPRVYKLASGAYSGPVGNTVSVDGYGDTVTSALPAGNYNVHVHYAGDATFSPADSASIAVSIGKEASTTTGSSYSVAANANSLPTSSFTYGGPAVYLSTGVSGASGTGVPTGTITYAVSRNGSALAPLTVNLDATGSAYFYSGLSIPNYFLKADYPQLTPGTYTVTTSYSGDSTFGPSSTSSSFTVAQATPSLLFSAPANVVSGASTQIAVTIALPTSLTAPNPTVAYATGTVLFADTTTGTTLGSCTLTNGTCSISTTAITSAAASHTLTATYSGDSNYSIGTANATVTVGSAASTTVTVALNGTPTVGYTDSLQATVTPASATGTVAFYDGSTYLGSSPAGVGSCTLSNGTCSISLAVSGSGGYLTAGTHTFTAVYNGNSSYTSSTGTTSATIAKSTTTVAFSAPANSTYGQPVVVSAYISRSVNTTSAALVPLTGTLTILDGNTPVGAGTPVFDPAGYTYYTARIVLSTLAGGSHTLSAVYSGDANFSGATAAATPIINIAPLAPGITLTTTASAFAAGSPVYLTATIPLSSTLATPMAPVTLTNLGTTATYNVAPTYNGSLGAYVAVFSLAGLSGQNTFTASLAGDSNYAGVTSAPLTITILTNNIWTANGNRTVSGLGQSGTAVTGSASAGGGTGVAIDSTGDVWSLSPTSSSVTEFTKTGALVGSFTGSGTIASPSALTLDGAGVVWVANAATLTGVTNAGAAVTPQAYTTGFSTPTSINVDASGNIWVTNAGDNSVSEVIGAATPVTTPQTTAVKNATVAARP